MEITNLKVGDRVEYRGVFGADAPKVAEIIGLGTNKGSHVVDLDNGSWAYEHQIIRVLENPEIASEKMMYLTFERHFRKPHLWKIIALTSSEQTARLMSGDSDKARFVLERPADEAIAMRNSHILYTYDEVEDFLIKGEKP